MPIFKQSKTGGNSPFKRSLVEKIKGGKVVPLISNDVIVDLVLDSYHDLILGYGNHIQYPLENEDDLLQMAKFRSINADMDSWGLNSEFLLYVKNHVYLLAEATGMDEDILEEAAEEVDDVTVSAFAERLGYPKFEGQQDPLLILADLPLPIYLTTSPYTFIEAALEKAGKQPRTEICRWHTGLESLDSVFEKEAYEPSVSEPVVYHLHGLDERPDSLVLTEDDYLNYLVNISKGDQGDPIPKRIRQAMSDSALMLLGYELPSWSFRVLFWGLIQPASMTHKGIFVVELEGSEVQKQYLSQYLKREANFEAHWMNIADYVQNFQGVK